MSMLGYLRDSFKGDDSLRIDSGNEKRHSEFQFNRSRNMPIAAIFGHNGFFLFSSEHSFDKFKQTKFDFPLLDAEGVGLPLFHFQHQFTLSGNFTSNSPFCIIYKYVLQSNEDSPPYSEFKAVAKDRSLILYKIPFCEIFRRFDFVRTEFELKFASQWPEGASPLLVKGLTNRDLHTRLNNRDLCWHISFFPVGASNHYKLLVLDDNVPSLLDDSETKKRKKKLEKKTEESFSIAHYTRKYRDMLPHTVSKRSNVIVGEQSEATAYGITSVPWNTQVIACEGMLIHFLEQTEREGGG